MRVLIIDPFHGAAGDMITGALLGCGADKKAVMRAMAAVAAEPSVKTVTRAGIRAVRVETKAAPAHRTIREVLKRLDGAAPEIPAPALAMARRVFDRIHAAETAVHGEHVHFHEVGADDAIADIAGACTALHHLAVDGISVLPVTLGHGTVRGSHGTFPVPAPATAVILQQAGLSATAGSRAGELCTPTGAALLAEFAMLDPGRFGAYTIQAAGYGAGTRNPRDAPNVLRAMVVETAGGKASGSLQEDTVDILETNVDDVSGEVVAAAIARFMEAGARDACATPVLMKKGRPGYLISVISLSEMSASLAELMARELGTLGVRCIPAVHRFVAERSTGEVGITLAGKRRNLPAKCGMIGGRVYTLKAEFGPAQEFADEIGVPVRDVLRAVGEQAGKKLKK